MTLCRVVVVYDSLHEKYRLMAVRVNFAIDVYAITT